MTSRLVQVCCMLLQILHVITCIFFHEPSFIHIKPPGIVSKDTDFGFSIAYQNGSQPNLVVGSPHADLVGQVFSCPIKNVLRKLPCKRLDIDVEKVAPSIRDGINPQQKFCLGASIAATPDYFLTCAPLWTTVANKLIQEKIQTQGGAFGTCFVYNETGTFRFHGTVERHETELFNTPLLSGIIGGTGWSTLVDHTNNLLIIGKPTVYGDIIQVNTIDPLAPTRSIVFDRNKNYKRSFSELSNLGYALASGNFFSERKAETFYAFSMQNKHRIGQIQFLDKLERIEFEDRTLVTLFADESGSLFGAALSGADVNADGLADLLVGAQAQANDEYGFEAGALFIYLGGSMETISSNEKKKAILAEKYGSRFGATIATSDIDGDRLPEIFVSAPYEDLGIGALYILSGYEVNYKLIKPGNSREVSLSDLSLTQRVQMENFRSLGFSLQVVPDVIQNGCDELAVGSPPKASVLLFRCIPSITVTVSTKLIDKVVAEYDTNFTVKVCVDITYPEKLGNITVTKLSVVNKIIGYGATVTKPKFDVKLTEKPMNHCEDVVVKLSYNESGYYNFTANLESNIDLLLLNKDFDSTWVSLSPHSKTDDTLDVTRHCAEADCTPHIRIDQIVFAGRDGAFTYLLGVQETEKVVVYVRNNGGSAYDGCVRLNVTGARVASIGCGSDDAGAYKCYLPRPLLRNARYQIEILLNMSKSTNMDHNLYVEAFLYTNCKHENSTKTGLYIRYSLDTAAIRVDGSPHRINVTDRNINDKTKTITDSHEYTIVNKGSVKWTNVGARMSLQKEPFITKYKVSATQSIECDELDKTATVEFQCTVHLLPHSTLKIIVTTEILIHRIVQNLKNAKVETSSKLTLNLKPTNETKEKGTTTEIHYQNQLTVGNNKWLIILIAVFVAVIFLTFMVFILYRVGFFKRKTKTELDSFKESVRRQSVKQSASEGNEASAVPEGDDDLDDLELEVVEENPFEGHLCPTTTADDAALIVDNKLDKEQDKSIIYGSSLH